jgi:hypothetical protein
VRFGDGDDLVQRDRGQKYESSDAQEVNFLPVGRHFFDVHDEKLLLIIRENYNYHPRCSHLTTTLY